MLTQETGVYIKSHIFPIEICEYNAYQKHHIDT